jgi:restriction system protein
MGVPDFQSFFKPLLEFAADGEEHSIREGREVIARSMNLSEGSVGERASSSLPVVSQKMQSSM